MRYFRLKQDKRIQNVATIDEKLDVEKMWESTDGLFFPYKIINSGIHKQDVNFLPLIECTAGIMEKIFAVSEKTKKVFETYQIGAEYRNFGLGNLKKRDLQVYHFMKPLEVECLSEKTEFKPNKEVKRLVLDRAKIGENRVFQVKELRANYLIVSLEIVEVLLQKYINEFEIIEVECEG